MLEIVAGVVALVSLGVSALLATRVKQLEQRIRSLTVTPTPAAQLPPLVEEKPRPLEGLRIAVEVKQDHPHPVFANLLKELLLAEDVAEITAGDQEYDIRIAGEIVCNGYAEVYYTADLTCSTHQETICAIAERPPHGDRPANLGIEIVTKLKTELEKLVSRTERRRALKELGG